MNSTAATSSGQTPLSAMRCGATLAVVLGLVFVACWAAAAAELSGGSHLYVSLFMTAPAASPTALIVGLLCSLVAGFLVGAAAAMTYNRLGLLV